MNNNKFLEKFKTKSDSELKYILDNPKSYTEKAKRAAIILLKERGTAPDIEHEITIQPQKRELVMKNSSIKTENNITDDINAPEMHSKGIIRIFSVLFSTIFGAGLLMFNLKQIHKTKERHITLLFGILYTLASITIINTISSNRLLVTILNFGGGSILTEYFWNKYIGEDFKHGKRNWLKPFLIAIIICLPIIWSYTSNLN